MGKSKEYQAAYYAKRKNQNSTPLLKGDPKTVSTYKSDSVVLYYNDEALDATFDSKTGVLSFDWAKDRDWGKRSAKRQYLDITVANGMINGDPVNLDLSKSSIKSINAPKKLSSKTEKTLRSNGFDYNSKSGRWEKGYKGYSHEGSTLTVDSKLPSDLSSYKVVKGNTYDHRADIKKAGFKWDGKSKSWVK